MTISEAKHIAEQYVLEMGEILPGFRFGVGVEEEFTGKFYFDFVLLTLDGKQSEEPPFAGGPRGLTVNKQNREVEVLSFGEYAALKNTEDKLTATYQLLVDFKNGKMRLTEVRAKFNLNSEELLKFSKVIESTELSREKTYAIVKELLDKSRDSAS
jgi:hypothetical protein